MKDAYTGTEVDCDHPADQLLLSSDALWCDKCGAYAATTEQLIEVWVEYTRMVKTGIAVLTDELETMRADMAAAAGAFSVPIPVPGSDMAKVMSTNSLLKRRVEALWKAVVDLKDLALAHPGSRKGAAAVRYLGQVDAIVGSAREAVK